MKEIRYFETELRLNPDNPNVIEGYALKFNRESNVLYDRKLGYFIEKINPKSLRGVIETSDIFCLLNHNKNKGVLARSKNGTGSLKLSVDDIGLKYSFDIDTRSPVHMELLSNLERGEITASSFAFCLPDNGGEIITRHSTGKPLREIVQFERLFDVSPVYQPAYESTEVQKIRSIDEFIEAEERQLSTEDQQKADKLEQEKKRKQELYIKSLKNKYLGN